MLTIVNALLNGHPAADARERDSLERTRALAAGARAPFSRAHFEPGHLTASAIVVDPAREHTLLIFHAKLKMWVQPGGHFEAGECDPSAAAAREVLEETGLETYWPGEVPKLLDVDVHPIPARKDEPAHFHFDLRMFLVAEKMPPSGGDEGVSDARWVGRGEWQEMDLDPGLQRALRKIWGA
jgi:8-oxo-dGTP pyrophosphatase MutT (NUDIX family)